METQNLLKLMSSPDIRNVPEKEMPQNDVGDWLHQSVGDLTILSVADFKEHSANSAASVLLEENNVLRNNYKYAENSLYKMHKENELLLSQLNEERHRAESYQKKLQYIQDNQDVFNRLKQAYLNMKYNESVTRPVVEIREAGCQVDDLFPKTLVTKSESCMYEPRPGIIPVNQKDLDAVRETVKTLAEFIRTKSESGLSDIKEAKYRKDIACLFQENLNLKQKITDQFNEMEQIRNEPNQKKLRENCTLKRIIAKMGKKLRFYESSENITITDSVTSLNHKEKSLVDLITSKYDEKYKVQYEIVKESTPFVTPRNFENQYGPTNDTESILSFRSCEGDEDEEM